MRRLTGKLITLALLATLFGCETAAIDTADVSEDIGADTTTTEEDGTAIDAATGLDASEDAANSQPDASPDASADASPDADVDPGCPATHARVGWVAELSTKSHAVSGHAEIIDDCTVRITDFHFDGGGIDVRIYGAKDANYLVGFPMTEDLVRPTPYSGETIIARLPTDVSLDDLDGISAWCVDFAVDFGSGTFAAP
ncbi:MAG: DM13 domain-containing protein [Bradymonadaceae bacterium]|nr:DM13 domain-containing protein [Lujinxingiaceae bacterium]